MKKVVEETSNFCIRDNNLEWVKYYSEHSQMMRETSLLRQNIKNLNTRLKQSLVENTYSSMTNLFSVPNTKSSKKIGLNLHSSVG